jgi:hypothetical protein
MEQYKKYALVFLITCSIFAVAFALSMSIGDRRVEVVKSTADKISVDILSMETQFEIFQESSCETFTGSVLTKELSELGRRLDYTESDRGSDDEEVVALKKYYSLLEIKDYLLMKKVGERCGLKPLSILYFYSNNDCEDCTKQGYVLTKLQEEHPDARVYSFDYNLDLNATKALIAVHRITNELPAMVIDGKTYHGYMEFEEIEALTPRLASTTRVSNIETATSTK